MSKQRPMKENIYKAHLFQAQQLWSRLLRPYDQVIDATCGNGKDSHFLANLLPQGHLYSIDIQKIAIEKAKKSFHHPNVSYLLQSHATLPDVPDLRLVVYNLGYLPGGNKKITTQVDSTMSSLEAAKQKISPGGAISILCYPGHLEGALEEKAVSDWIEQLSSEKWSLFDYQWKKNFPHLFFIKQLEKL